MKKVEEMKFDLDFGANPPAEDLPPRVAEMLRFIDGLPDGKLIDIFKLMEMGHFTYSEVRHQLHHPALRNRKSMRGRYAILGNETTITAWKRQHGKA